LAVPVPLTDGADTVADSIYVQRRLAEAIVPLTDGNDSVDGSLKKAVIHPGSRGGGLVGSTNVVAVFERLST
jgi:hypothetical protein